eukprot:10320768-Alexandrium_andersonii.AAC.1
MRRDLLHTRDRFVPQPKQPAQSSASATLERPAASSEQASGSGSGSGGGGGARPLLAALSGGT